VAHRPSLGFVETMDGLLDGGRTLVQCLPTLLLETARTAAQPAPAAAPRALGGTACLWLDLPEEAKRHAEHAFELRDTVAAKALARLDVAAASNQLGRPTEASQIGAEVLQMPADHLIDPIVRRATELATSLEPHSSPAEVRDFNERLASLVPASGEPRAASSAAER
jgi:hypothetical protein